MKHLSCCLTASLALCSCTGNVEKEPDRLVSDRVCELQKEDSGFMVRTTEGSLETLGREVADMDRHYSFYYLPENGGDVRHKMFPMYSFYAQKLSVFSRGKYYYIHNTDNDVCETLSLYRYDYVKDFSVVL